jgi:hypothetical protein
MKAIPINFICVGMSKNKIKPLLSLPQKNGILILYYYPRETEILNFFGICKIEFFFIYPLLKHS